MRYEVSDSCQLHVTGAGKEMTQPHAVSDGHQGVGFAVDHHSGRVMFTKR